MLIFWLICWFLKNKQQYNCRKQLQDLVERLFCILSAWWEYSKYVIYAVFGQGIWFKPFQWELKNVIQSWVGSLKGVLRNPRKRQSRVFHQRQRLKNAETYFLSIRTWTFLLLTRLSLLWRFWKGNSENHWRECTVCFRREPLAMEQHSGKAATFNLTTSTWLCLSGISDQTDSGSLTAVHSGSEVRSGSPAQGANI